MVVNLNIALNSGRIRLRFFFFMAFIALTAILTVPGKSPASVSSPVISKIEIEISASPGTLDHWDRIVRDLIPLKPGDPYTPEKLLTAISVLSESGLFETIRVPDPDTTDRAVRIRMSVTPFRRIEDIRVTGAFPIFKREITQIMTLVPGGPFSDQLLAEQKSRIETLLKREGFPNPGVFLSSQKGKAEGRIVVDVKIEKGPYYTVEKVAIKGNHKFSDFRLKLRTHTWKSSLLPGSGARFTQKELDADVKNFIRFYQKQGFSDVKVAGTIQKDDLRKTVAILFEIHEGPQYRVRFEGNKQISTRVLKKEVAAVTDRGLNNLVLKKAGRDLEKRYAESGFPEAAVTPEIKQQLKEEKTSGRLTFRIDEGQKYVVSVVTITGNTGIDEKQIRQQILTGPPGVLNHRGYSPKTLQEDISAIRALYLTEGYTRTRIEKTVRFRPSPKEGAVTLVDIELKIIEGVRTRIGTVSFHGLTALDAESATVLISLKPGQVYREYMIKNDEGLIKKELSEKGYPYIRVWSETVFSEDNSTADLNFHIEEGPHVVLGQVFYSGNLRTREKTLDAEMEMQPGDPFSLTRLLKSQQNLMDVNALDSVKIRAPGLKDKLQEVDLVVDVQEKAPYFFEAGTGYDTERHFYLKTRAGDHNFSGRNLDLEAGIEASQIGYKGNLSLSVPRILSTRIASTTEMTIEDREEFNKDYGVRTVGLSQNFQRMFLEKSLTAGLEFRHEYRELYLTGKEDPSFFATEIDDPRNIVVASPSIVFRTTDSHVRPRKGTLSAVYLDISKGLDNNLDDYIKFRFDTRWYCALSDPLTLAVRGRYRYAEPYGENRSIPEDQLFFLGGTTSVRGFDENLLQFDAEGQAVGGREAVLGSIEARYDLGMNLEFTAFFDTGRLSRTQDAEGSDRFRSSVGIGLRYITPIGPIGLLYGWKLDPLEDESSGSFHFSMGYTF